MNLIRAGFQHLGQAGQPVLAIQAQRAQLLQVTLSPAVGAWMKVLPGLSVRSLCIMPVSVATMNSGASDSRAAFNMA